MRNSILFFLMISAFSFAQTTTTPSPALADGAVSISFNKTGTPLASYTGTIYAHIGLTVDGQRWQNVKGSWGNNSTQPSLTLVSGTTYKLDFGPNLYTYFGVPTSSSISEICVVFRSADGSLKNGPDLFLNVGAFQANLTTPSQNSATILNSGNNFAIAANNTNGVAAYTLKANGEILNTATTSTFSYTHSAITSNQKYELVILQGSTTITIKFSVIVNPGTVSEAIPTGLEDGINYNFTDATKATLVLDAPGKDFIYVAGSFNNWQPNSNYAMKKDPINGKFWLELSGLISGVNNTYQYWVVDTTPLSGSPTIVKTADPYSTLVLSPYDDPYIPATSYPNLPPYPAGQEREVTVLQTGQTPYAWSTATTNFVKPDKEKLVVYELLVRDFDANRSYQDLINKIDYFKNLKINAIELLPVMEFEGNESWGYNTSFHMALDKFYGTSDKLKEFIDLCHQNGIAVIMDVALNHAFGRNPMIRMWMNDPDGDGWGSPTSENPYFNTVAKHSYSVGEDFNHQQPRTQYYVERVVKQWIQEYKIDGFRWDLTKGFTQNCTASDQTCTNNTQADRVAVLKKYADYSWSLDPSHYTIFEHLGGNAEEQQWANYRITGEADGISKGIMMWGNSNYDYNQLTMGYAGNISNMNSANKGFTKNRIMGYAESHDEERLMYKNKIYGNSTNAAYNVKTLNTGLSRMSALGAVSLLIPGPKMIYHFGELGWDTSIFTCNNGTVNTSTDATTGDCKLDTKPQPQWSDTWLEVVNRKKIYTDWTRMIDLKTTESVFSGTATMANLSSLTPNIRITNSTLASGTLKDVLIIANFDVNSRNVATGFPYTGIWYNLMDNTSYTVSDANATINLPAGDFRVYGNYQTSLSTSKFENSTVLKLAPNPASAYFMLNLNARKVELFSITGQLVKSFPRIAEENQYEISDLKSGIYLVKVTDENFISKTMKLIKQ